jgi:hypothetical protein
MPQPDRPATDELELPPLDGASDEEPATPVDEDVSIRQEDDPYDDAAGDDDDFTERLAPTEEPTAVGDDTVGFVGDDHDAVVESPSQSLLGDDDAPGVAGEDFALIDKGDSVRDGGEEGFDAPEPELRVEDLPQLDEGDDDDLSLEEAGDEIPPPAPLRWDDRGFERVLSRPLGHVVRIRVRGGVEVTLEDGSVLRSVDGGETFSSADRDDADDDEAFVVRGRVRALLRDGVGILRSLDDGPLVLLESTADATAFTVLDDGSIVAAIDRRLLRISLDGAATVAAEEESAVEAVAVDPRSGVVFCGGAFGLLAYRPG